MLTVTNARRYSAPQFFAALLLASSICVGIFTPTSSVADDSIKTSGTPDKGNKDMNSNLEIATFAGGCFWCLQPSFDGEEGVTETYVGYTDGTKKNPTYEEVSSGTTGHTEGIEVHFDPAKTSYEKLLEVFWRQIDPTQVNGQFADHGTQYRTAIFYHSDEQKAAAEKSKAALAASGKFSKPIATSIAPASEFYRAEEYHQKYYLKSSSHYKMYKEGSGRAPYIRNTWEKK